MKNLKNFVTECTNDIESLGIELGNIKKVEINSRAKSRWGRCSKRADGYYIQISDRLLNDDVSDDALKNTIAHELLHTIKGGMCHTGEWKKASDLLNSVYDYSIKRVTSSEEKGIHKEFNVDYKYVLRCCSCGHEYRYHKFTKTVQRIKLGYTSTYRCGKCGKFDTLYFKAGI